MPDKDRTDRTLERYGPTTLSKADERIIEEAWARANPSIFLNHYMRPQDGGFYVYPGSKRHAAYKKYWLSLDRPAVFTAESGEIRFEVVPRFGDYAEFVAPGGDGFDPVTPEDCKLAFFEKRGQILLPWQLDFWRAPQERKTAIGTPGTGKTLGMALCASFECATIPYYRFLNVAPTVYQSNIMIRELRQRVVGTAFEAKFLLPGHRGYKEKPYATYTYWNHATGEFMNIARNAENIQGWRGDRINMDEAGLANGQNDSGGIELADMMPGMTSRLTGERPDGKPRKGILTLISMAYDNDALWQNYDYGLEETMSRRYYSVTVTVKDNPYITSRQWSATRADVERNVPPAMQASWLFGVRPPKAGAEFPANLVEAMFVDELPPDATVYESGVGVYDFQSVYQPGHVYLMAGDPGMGDPPHRNAPGILVFDVTDFPLSAAHLAAFWWGYANGSILPFLNRFHELAALYRVPNSFRGYDSTSTQKALAELAFTTGEDDVIPLGFEGSKKWEYLNAAKILMSHGLVRVPKVLTAFKGQVNAYKVPDKGLAQDLVSALAMACYLMYPLYVDAYPEAWDEATLAKTAGYLDAAASRHYRPPTRDRNAGRSLRTSG